ncbi:tetratricopeptide repeat protein [Flavobacteriaceae bacterium]|nr:tetratricopeptide repeat protein [Flavobacteriaceae bacterium]
MGQIFSYSFSSTKNNFLLIFFLISTITTFGQNISALKDSIIKYKAVNPQKALNLSFKALNQFDLEEFTYDLVELNFYIGEIYFFKKDYDKSLKYLSQSLTIYESLPIDQRIHKNIEKLPWVLLVLGSVYYENENYEKAKALYKEAINNFNLFEEKYKENRINGLNTSEINLALISKKQLNFDQAMYYYERILERVNNELKENKNTYFLYTYLQIMDLYFISDDEDLAIKYFDLSTELYENEISNSEIQSFYSKVVSRYATHLKSKNRYEEAIKYFEKAKQLINDSSYEISNINILISECYLAINEYDKAEEIYLRNLKNKDLSLKDRIKINKGLAKVYYAQQRKNDLNEVYRSIIKLYSKNSTIINFNDLENQMIIAEKQREINNNKLKSYRNNILAIIILFLFIITMLILVFNYNYQKVKNSKLEDEKKKISIKLDAKKRELVSKANFILQRNEYLKNIKAKLDKSKVNEHFHNQISKEILELINSDKYYREFDKTFTKVYPEFYKRLNSKFKLSQTYLRLAAYIKMKQSNNEIAKITGITLRTVETQRYRLSKKLNLNKDQDLNTFLENL